jgi:hypothetical protein
MLLRDCAGIVISERPHLSTEALLSFASLITSQSDSKDCVYNDLPGTKRSPPLCRSCRFPARRGALGSAAQARSRLQGLRLRSLRRPAPPPRMTALRASPHPKRGQTMLGACAPIFGQPARPCPLHRKGNRRGEASRGCQGAHRRRRQAASRLESRRAVDIVDGKSRCAALLGLRLPRPWGGFCLQCLWVSGRWGTEDTPRPIFVDIVACARERRVSSPYLLLFLFSRFLTARARKLHCLQGERWVVGMDHGNPIPTKTPVRNTDTSSYASAADGDHPGTHAQTTIDPRQDGVRRVPQRHTFRVQSPYRASMETILPRINILVDGQKYRDPDYDNQ